VEPPARALQQSACLTDRTTDIIVYKIVPAPQWCESEREGTFHGSPVDARDGFIHLSSAEQISGTAARHFVGAVDLLLLAVRTASLDIRWEPSRGGDLFPHLYGALPMASVVWVRPLPLIDGVHVLPDLGP
jgi:uncharacterized protein (DUF952 family)